MGARFPWWPPSSTSLRLREAEVVAAVARAVLGAVVAEEVAQASGSRFPTSAEAAEEVVRRSLRLCESTRPHRLCSSPFCRTKAAVVSGSTPAAVVAAMSAAALAPPRATNAATSCEGSINKRTYLQSSLLGSHGMRRCRRSQRPSRIRRSPRVLGRVESARPHHRRDGFNEVSAVRRLAAQAWEMSPLQLQPLDIPCIVGRSFHLASRLRRRRAWNRFLLASWRGHRECFRLRQRDRSRCLRRARTHQFQASVRQGAFGMVPHRHFRRGTQGTVPGPGCQGARLWGLPPRVAVAPTDA